MCIFFKYLKKNFTLIFKRIFLIIEKLKIIYLSYLNLFVFIKFKILKKYNIFFLKII